jgi:hypothetical protein
LKDSAQKTIEKPPQKTIPKPLTNTKANKPIARGRALSKRVLPFILRSS